MTEMNHKKFFESKIPFNKPGVLGNELENLIDLMTVKKFSGDGEYTKRCHFWFEKNILPKGKGGALLTTSCSHALEMTAILSNISEGDEVIMPSFTFTSTANAFVMRGANIVFVDIRPDTMNIDESKIEEAITDKTRAIVPVHYAGVPCEMDTIMSIAERYNLTVIEDAAQAILSKYKGQNAGVIGDLGTYSFHETKNIHCGEGGVLFFRDSNLRNAAEELREKGTNRSRFFRGEIDKYGWVSMGSSYLPSEFQAAFLLPQLEQSKMIIEKRLDVWNLYRANLEELEEAGKIELPVIPEHCEHNGHIFYIKTKNLQERSDLIDFLAKKGIHSVFHYIPLHSSPAGEKFGRFYGDDVWTTRESERLLRLPMWYGLEFNDVSRVADIIRQFYNM